MREVQGDLREFRPEKSDGGPAAEAPEHKGTWGRPKAKCGAVFAPKVFSVSEKE